MHAWRVCAKAWTNVTLHLEEAGYPPHGHDVEIEACVESERRGLLSFDLEVLRSALEDLASSIRYRPLREVAGGGALEDLLAYACRRLSEVLGVRPASVKASLPWGSVELSCARANPS